MEQFRQGHNLRFFNKHNDFCYDRVLNMNLDKIDAREKRQALSAGYEDSVTHIVNQHNKPYFEAVLHNLVETKRANVHVPKGVTSYAYECNNVKIMKLEKESPILDIIYYTATDHVFLHERSTGYIYKSNLGNPKFDVLD